MISQDFLDKFPERLQLLRSELNLSQIYLGKQVESSKQSIANLENGNRTPGIDLFIRLADYFQVSLDYLAGRSDSREIK